MSSFRLTCICLALFPRVGCALPLGWYHVTVPLFSLTPPQSFLVTFPSCCSTIALLTLPVLHLAVLVGFSQILTLVFRGTVLSQMWFHISVAQHSGGWAEGL